MDHENNNAFCTKVLEMYQQGFSCKDIASACSVPTLRVRNHLRALGINTRNYRKVSESNKNKVLLLIKNNYPYVEIERLLHVSTHVIREIVQNNGLIGFAPKYHHPRLLKFTEKQISLDLLAELRVLFLSGKYGLGLCADKLGASDDEFLWFVHHLTTEDVKAHHNHLVNNIQLLAQQKLPVTAIAKRMDISPSIVKKILKGLH